MISGIHHLGLTVRDVDASAAWYERVLGFQRVDRYDSPDGARRKVFLSHDRLSVRLGGCSARLADAGVEFSPIAPANSIRGAFVLVLRDPDNIQLEFSPTDQRPLADNTSRSRRSTT